jgi:hypothetical protein
VHLTWQGETLTYAHTSAPLFPTITAWRAVVYDADKSPISVQAAMDDQARSQPTLDWQPYLQQVEGLRNCLQPHAVLFFREHREALQAGQRLAGYLATTVRCPEERDAVLRFGSPGPAEIYVNGNKLEPAPVEEDAPEAFLLRGIKQTAPFKLKQGINHLLIDTRPPQEGRPFWVFGAGLSAPGGAKAMADLTFE